MELPILILEDKVLEDLPVAAHDLQSSAEQVEVPASSELPAAIVTGSLAFVAVGAVAVAIRSWKITGNTKNRL